MPGAGGSHAQISERNQQLVKAGGISAQISVEHVQLPDAGGNNTKISEQNRQLLKAGQIHAQICEEHVQVPVAEESHAQNF